MLKDLKNEQLTSFGPTVKLGQRLRKIGEIESVMFRKKKKKIK